MNLMNMLSEDRQDTGPPEILFYDEISDRRPTTSQDNHVYYLPTVFSAVQRDISEAIIHTLRNSIEKEIINRRQRGSINSILQSSESSSEHTQKLERARLVDLLDDQLRAVCKHPLLLVDHIVPKRLLLSELPYRLLHLSGKIELFSRLVDLISEAYEEDTRICADFNLLVVAESVREVEWIEGTVINKKVCYKNLSSRKLHDDGETSPKQSAATQPADDIALELGDRRLRSRVKPTIAKPKFVVHLVSLRQLYLNFAFSSTFNAIFSFDPSLDLSSSSIEIVRSSFGPVTRFGSASLAPVIFPTPLFSLEHLTIKHVEDSGSPSSDSASSKASLIDAYLLNRHKMLSSEFQNYPLGEDLHLLRQWLFSWDNLPFPDKITQLAEFSEQITMKSSDEALLDSLHTEHFAQLGKIFKQSTNGWDNGSQLHIPSTESVDYNTVKRLVAEFLHSRVEQIETIVHEGRTSVLPLLREKESRRQLDLDEHENQIGENYRKLRKLNDVAASSERKLARYENDSSVEFQAEHELEEVISHIRDMANTKSDDELADLTAEQEKVIAALSEEETKLQSDLETAITESESLRNQYQNMSGEALNSTAKATDKQAQAAELEKRIKKPGMHLLPSLSRKDELAMYENKLAHKIKESQFVEIFMDRELEKLVKERRQALEHNTSGSSSRPGTRISRDSTPFV